MASYIYSIPADHPVIGPPSLGPRHELAFPGMNQPSLTKLSPEISPLRPEIASLRLEISPLRPEISPHLLVISLHWAEFSLIGWNQTSETWSNLFRPPHLFPGCMETHPCVLQDIGPLRSLPCSHLTSSPKHSKQGNGYR